MFEVTKKIYFNYGHRLIKHQGKCQNYHGHNGIAEIICSSKTLNENEMVIDFETISDKLKKWVDENLDHRMILNKKDDLIELLERKKHPYYSVDGEPTAEKIAEIIYKEAKNFNLPIFKVILWETSSSSASYSEPS